MIVWHCLEDLRGASNTLFFLRGRNYRQIGRKKRNGDIELKDEQGGKHTITANGWKKNFIKQTS